MIFWPFWFCQKPIVSPPLLQFFTDALDVWPVSTILAVLFTVWQPLDGGVNVLEYLNVFGESATHAVPSVPPYNVSVTVMHFFASVVGVVNEKFAVPLAVPSGVKNAPASQVAVAVLVPLADVGADDHVHG